MYYYFFFFKSDYAKNTFHAVFNRKFEICINENMWVYVYVNVIFFIFLLIKISFAQQSSPMKLPNLLKIEKTLIF